MNWNIKLSFVWSAGAFFYHLLKRLPLLMWLVIVVTKCFALFQDIFKQATEDRLTSAKELPYFEGDFWPNVLEESIKELEQEEEERKREENTSNESTDVRMLLLFHDLM